MREERREKRERDWIVCDNFIPVVCSICQAGTGESKTADIHLVLAIIDRKLI